VFVNNSYVLISHLLIAPPITPCIPSTRRAASSHRVCIANRPSGAREGHLVHHFTHLRSTLPTHSLSFDAIQHVA
jgi:hypothetical protein